MICGECTAEIATGEWDPRPSQCPSCRRNPILGGVYRLEEEQHRTSQMVLYRATRLADGVPLVVTEFNFPPSDKATIRAEARRSDRATRRINTGDLPWMVECVVAGGRNGRTSVYVVEQPGDEQPSGWGEEQARIWSHAADMELRHTIKSRLPPGTQKDIGVDEMTRCVREVLFGPIQPTSTAGLQMRRWQLIFSVSISLLFVVGVVFTLLSWPQPEELAQVQIEEPEPPSALDRMQEMAREDARVRAELVAEEVQLNSLVLVVRPGEVEEGNSRDSSESKIAAQPEQKRSSPSPTRARPSVAQKAPQAIGPLRLGMSFEQAQQAVSDERNWRRRAAGRPMPDGQHWWVQTPVLGEDIRCQVYICEEEGLCRLYCEKHISYAPEDYGKVRDEMLDKFRQRYGTATGTFRRDTDYRSWTWDHPDSQLRVRVSATPPENIRGDEGHGTIRIHLESAFYQRWHEQN